VTEGYVKDYLAQGSGEPAGSNLHFDVSSAQQTNALFPALHDKPHLLPLKITPATDIHHPETLGRGGRRGGTRCFYAHRPTREYCTWSLGLVAEQSPGETETKPYSALLLPYLGGFLSFALLSFLPPPPFPNLHQYRTKYRYSV